MFCFLSIIYCFGISLRFGSPLFRMFYACFFCLFVFKVSVRVQMRITQRGHTSRPSHDPQIFLHLLPLSLLFAAVLWDVIIAAVTSGPASLATGASALWQFPKCHSYWGHLHTQARQPTTSHSAGGLRSMRMWKSCSTFSSQRSFKFRFANLICGDVNYWHSKKNKM